MTTRARTRWVRVFSLACTVGWFLGACCVSPTSHAQGVPRTTAKPSPSDTVDHEVWRGALTLDAFKQAVPTPGVPPTQRTIVKLMHDGETLFGVVKAFEADPGRITARTLKRDAESIDADDHITLVLDPRGTAANGFVFRFNALGARRDGLVFDGNQFRAEWDATWQVRAQTDDDGWSATFAIPLAVMAVPADGRAWRFNVERYVAANGERMRLHNAVADRDVTSLPDAEPLLGITPSSQGWGLRLRPAVRWTSEQQGTGARRNSLKPSLDVVYALTPGVSLSATFNTDFSEADTDTRQVSLSRFELFRPEKRAFFTQDAGRFAFGGLDTDEPNPLPFFSRRVGLGSSLDAGLKLSGSAGPIEFGALAVQVRPLDGALTPRLGVVRAAGAVADGHRVGVVATSGNPEGTRGSGLAGVDYQARGDVPWGDGAWSGNAWWMQTRNADVGRGDAQGVSLRAMNDGPWVQLVLQSLGERFNPALGYVREPGVVRTEDELGWRHRLASGATVLSRVIFGGRRRFDGLERSHYLGPNVEYEAQGDVVGASYFAEREVVAAGFSVLPGVAVPAGDTRASLVEAYVKGSESRAWSGDAYVRTGSYFGTGRLHVQNGALMWRPSPHWALSMRGARQDVRLLGQRFVAKTAQASVEWVPGAESRHALVLARDNVSGATSVGVRSLVALGQGRQLLTSVDRLRVPGDASKASTLASIKLLWPWER
jgi:hypothetical protein